MGRAAGFGANGRHQAASRPPPHNPTPPNEDGGFMTHVAPLLLSSYQPKERRGLRELSDLSPDTAKSMQEVEGGRVSRIGFVPSILLQ